MKKVKITFFKPSGKYYTTEEGMISETLLGGTNDYWNALKELRRIKGMQMLVQDSGDNKEPYIVPHLFRALEGEQHEPSTD